MNKLTVNLAVVCLIAFSTFSHSELVFYDSFESGDKSKTNDYGFNWLNGRNPSVITSRPSEHVNSTIQGKHSLAFKYHAGSDMSEQRFQLGRSYQEIWFRYWVRVPTNFKHGTASPSNNKFLALWMDKYSYKGEGGSAYWSFWRKSAEVSTITLALNEGNRSSSGRQRQSKRFIKVPEDRGRWMQVVFHVKASSSEGSSDGYLSFWRRWKDEREFTQFHEVTGVELATPDTIPNGWNKGYLMGWANAPYSSDTVWLIDDFEVATHSLLSASNPRLPNPPDVIVK